MMRPFFADGIDIPVLLTFGIVVLVPLLAFQVALEAYVLRRSWHIAFRALCRFALVANCWSLLVGIPTKILNAFLYDWLLPRDLPGFFARYPFAIAMGTGIYVILTVLVEWAYARRWLRNREHSMPAARLWTGVLLANVASYAVLAPLHYYATRPMSHVREFTHHIRWTANPETTICYISAGTGHIEALRLDGSPPRTIVPLPVRDYLVSEDFGLCLFRDPAGNLVFYCSDTGKTNLVWQSGERFSMDQVAFSPSGRHVAFVSEKEKAVEVLDLTTGERMRQTLTFGNWDWNCSLGWSTEENRFFIGGQGTTGTTHGSIDPTTGLRLEPIAATDVPPLFPCYGRVGSARWYGGGDWGTSHTTDTCGDLKAWAERGLGSGLRVVRGEKDRTPVLHLYVNPGLLHMARFDFDDVAFLKDCRDCLFDASEYIYLLDIQNKRVGTVVQGDRFILLTPRYQKQLSSKAE